MTFVRSLFLTGLVLLGLPAGPALATPLSDYLKRPTPEFAWKEVERQALPLGGEMVTLDLESQVWQGIPWHHHLVIVQPSAQERAGHDSKHTGMILVTGSYDSGRQAQLLRFFTSNTGATAAVLYDVPNQPLFDNLREDGLIAYSFVQYLHTSDATWPLLFPMVKSVVGAMTAIQQFTAQSPATKLDHFVVAGASKRGWTTWLAGASDPRIVGIAPMVYNNLNINAQMPHQIDSWGAYSEQIADYAKTSLLDKRTSEAGQKLVQMVDPYSLRSNLALPKLLINGTNDRYWPLDAASLYYNDLSGDKHLLYVPNNGHGLETGLERLISGMEGFFNAVVAGKRLPDLDAATAINDHTVTLRVHPSETPESMVLWTATAATGDFRDSTWTSVPMTKDGDHYTGSATVPAAGHVALFAEAEYNQGGVRYHLSSPLSIVPAITHHPAPTKG